MKPAKIDIVVGARPNYMKMAPLYAEFCLYPDLFDPSLVHTGQHYDERMSKVFFEDLGMPRPHKYLQVGSGSHGVQTARIMERYEEWLFERKPDLVFVAGDVNSTLACTVDAVKLGIPVAHVEAGLRSFDLAMPEEINRMVTDRLSTYLLTPSPDGDANLLKEGTDPARIYRVGNIMIDSLKKHLQTADKHQKIMDDLGVKQDDYALITLHRPSNVDNRAGLEVILQALATVGKQLPLVFPMHPRTRSRITDFGLDGFLSGITGLRITEPLGYLEFLKLQKHAKLVITDSGGLQEETTWLQIPCLTLRENTERPITITEGTNRLVPLQSAAIVQAVEDVLHGRVKEGRIPELWDGRTAERIVQLFR